MKLLIIRFSTLGDIVLASPLVRSLRKAYPDAEIHFLTTEANRSAVEFNPYINKLQVHAQSRELMIEELRPENYDQIIDLQGDGLSLSVSRELHSKPLSINSKSFLARLSGLLGNQGGNIVDRYFNAVRSLKLTNDGAGLDYFISPHEETKKNDIPASHFAGYIACALDARKGWSTTTWKDFCVQMDHPIILLGGKEYANAAREIASADDIKIYNACGKFSINETADLIRKSKLLVCNGSDFMQVAAAFKRPIITIWDNKTTPVKPNPYYGSSYLSGNPDKPYDILSLAKTSVNDLLAAVKKRL